MARCWKSTITLLGLLLLASPSGAQVEWNGTLDLTFGLAGESSRFSLNNVVRDHRRLHLSLHQLNLALFAPVDEEVSVEARLTVDDWQPGQPGPPELRLAVVNWTPLGERASLSAGRFITPFGLHPQQQFLFERSFVLPPLAYGYFLNLSDARGVWPLAGTAGSFLQDDIGVTTINPFGLSTGIVASVWSDGERRRELTLALAGAAPSSARAWTDHPIPALVGRYGFGLGERWQLGLSASYGGWMLQESFPQYLRDPGLYRQLLAGSDLHAKLGMLTLESELIYSRWSAPRWVDGTGGYGSGSFAADPTNLAQPYVMLPSLLTGYLDARLDFGPELAESYLAARIDHLRPLPLDDRVAQASSGEQRTRWERQVTRWAIASGLPLSERVLLKVAYTDQVRSGETTPTDDWTLFSALSVVF